MLSSTIRSSSRLAFSIGARPVVARRGFVTARTLHSELKQSEKNTAYSLQEVEGPESLVSKGSKTGEIPTDFDQSTGLERLELLGLLAGVKVFDNSPLQSDRKGTMADPIIVDSYEKYRYVGCTGSPAGSHEVQWLRPSTEQVGRCWECGSVYKVNYLGIEDEHHHH